MAGAELVATGVTTVQAIVGGFLAAGEYEQLVAGVLAGLREAGLGVELALGISDRDEYIPPFPTPGHAPTPLAAQLMNPRRALDADAYEVLFARVRSNWAAPDDGIDVAVGPVAPQWCSDELLAACAARAEAGARVHTHLHESPLQVSGAYGSRPLTRLEHFGLVTPRLSAAHGVWLDPAEIELLASRDVTVVHCPGSNTHLGVGAAPVRHYLDRGLRVGLGLDSHSHVEPPDGFAEMRRARTVAADRGEPITASEALALATTGSAAALEGTAPLGSWSRGACGHGCARARGRHTGARSDRAHR